MRNRVKLIFLHDKVRILLIPSSVMTRLPFCPDRDLYRRLIWHALAMMNAKTVNQLRRSY